MRLDLRNAALWLMAFALAAGCSHQPTHNAPAAQVIVPAPITVPTAVTDDEALAQLKSDFVDDDDYDDLYDRMRAGFEINDVDDNAVDQQLAWYVHNPDYLSRVFA